MVVIIRQINKKVASPVSKIRTKPIYSGNLSYTTQPNAKKQPQSYTSPTSYRTIQQTTSTKQNHSNSITCSASSTNTPIKQQSNYNSASCVAAHQSSNFLINFSYLTGYATTQSTTQQSNSFPQNYSSSKVSLPLQNPSLNSQFLTNQFNFTTTPKPQNTSQSYNYSQSYGTSQKTTSTSQNFSYSPIYSNVAQQQTSAQPKQIQHITNQKQRKLSTKSDSSTQIKTETQNDSNSFEIQTHICPLCQQNLTGKKFIEFPKCEHRICLICFKKYARSQIKSKNCCTIKCPTKCCKTQLCNSKFLKETNLFEEWAIDLFRRKLGKHFSYVNKDKPCPKCKCPKCNLSNHDGYTCEQNLQYHKRIRMVKGLEKKGKEFLQDTERQHNFSKFIFNKLLYKGCPAWRRFEKALEKYNFISVEEVIQSGYFLWHGTPGKNINSIKNNGFNPRKRKVQEYGEGEYFSKFIEISNYYCDGGNELLLVFVLNSCHHKLFVLGDGLAYILNNPVDWKESYCLPLFVVTL
ncbi:RBR-type E3 ubiquitin transferase [Entamoeba marina]